MIGPRQQFLFGWAIILLLLFLYVYIIIILNRVWARVKAMAVMDNEGETDPKDGVF